MGLTASFRCIHLPALIGLVGCAFGQESTSVETYVQVDLASKYVWRGVVYSNDWVLQPGGSMSWKNLTLGVWTNIELTSWNRDNFTSSPRGRFTEVDTSLEYAGTWTGGSWRIAAVDYQFPNTGWEPYREWFAAMAYETDAVGVELELSGGLGQASGTAATLSLSKSVVVGRGEGDVLDLLGQIGCGDSNSNGFYYESPRSGLSFAGLNASRTFEVGQGWSVTPSLNFSTLLDKALLAGEPRRTNVWFSIGVSRKL